MFSSHFPVDDAARFRSALDGLQVHIVTERAGLAPHTTPETLGILVMPPGNGDEDHDRISLRWVTAGWSWPPHLSEIIAHHLPAGSRAALDTLTGVRIISPENAHLAHLTLDQIAYLAPPKA